MPGGGGAGGGCCSTGRRGGAARGGGEAARAGEFLIESRGVSKPLARAGQLRPQRLLNRRLREQGSSARTLELEEEVAELRSTTGAMVALNKQQKGEITRMYKEHIDAMQLRQVLRDQNRRSG
eukprot:COSAG01_NODE_4003_length_5442_cov_6.778027_3_plen_123_part_00